MSKSGLLMIWPCSQGVRRQANTHVKLNAICLHSRANQTTPGALLQSPMRAARADFSLLRRFAEVHAPFGGNNTLGASV